MILTKDKIISIFCLIDDILKGINHKKDIRRRVSDSEVILTAIISPTSFYGKHCSAISFVRQYGFITNMLDKSRFNRRLQHIGRLLYELFEILGTYFTDFFYELATLHHRFLSSCYMHKI